MTLSIPSDWQEVPIENVCSLVVDCVNKTAPTVSEITPYKMLRTSNIKNGRIDLSDIKYVTKEIFERWTRREIPKMGDVILTREAPLGEVGMIYEENVFLGQRLMMYRADPQKLDNRFLLYALMSNEVQHEIKAMGSGSTVEHMRVPDAKLIPIPLPPIEEQREIAHILGSLDDKIEANRRQNEALEATARALFKSWFVDFDPVHAKANGEQPLGMDAATADLFPDSFQESELGMIPRGWEVVSLDDIAHYQNGLAMQKFPPVDDEYLPVLKIRELRQGFTDEKSNLARTDIKESCIVHDGDVIFSWSGSLMLDIWTGGLAGLNQHLFKVTSKEFPRWFYYFWTSYHLMEFIHIAATKATTMGHIKRSHLKDALVVVPPLNLIEHVNDLLESYLEKKILVNLESRTLAETRDALLPQLVSGQLRVGDLG